MKAILSIFTTWWKPLVGLVGVLLLFGLGTVLQRDSIITAFIYSMFAVTLLIAISFVVQLFKMNWLGALVQGVVIVPVFYYFQLIFTYSPLDYFATHLTIPEGITVEKPIISGDPKIDLKSEIFVLESIAPGIYQYLTAYVPTEEGVIYAKAYEITNEERLSSWRMKKRSTVEVVAGQKGIKKGRFTIYEGQWGQYYGARIELWFKSDDGYEELIGTKNYIVEGWMK